MAAISSRVHTARFSTAGRGCSTRTGDREDHADARGFLWRRSRALSVPNMVGFVSNSYTLTHPVQVNYFTLTLPLHGPPRVISKHSLGHFTSNHHLPLRRWPRLHLRRRHHPRRCVFPSQTRQDSEKQARSFVPTRRSLRPYQTTLIIVLAARLVLKITALIIPASLIDSYAQDRIQRLGHSRTRRNSSLSRTQKSMTFPPAPTITPSSPSYCPLLTDRIWSELTQRNPRNGAMVGGLAR